MSTLAAPSRRSTLEALPLPHEGMLVSSVAIALGAAGIVHLAVGPEHMAESMAIGAAMLLAGLAQLALAVLVARRPRFTLPLVASVALNLALVGAYVAALTVGLPGEAHGHGGVAPVDAHAALGHVEAATPLGVGTSALQLFAAGVATLVVVHRARATGRSVASR